MAKGATRNGAGSEPRRIFPWRRLGSSTLGLVLLIVLMWGGWRLLEMMDQPLEQVVINGRFQHLDVARLQRTVQARVDAGLLAADLTAIQQQILEEPWVAMVSVRRKWPNLLQIDLVERSPLVRWNQDALMTAQAVIFRPSGDLARYQLPRLVGDEPYRREILDQYHRLSSQLEPYGLGIRRLVREPRGAWQVLLAGGQLIELGSGEIDEKVRRFQGLYRAVLGQQLDRIEKIDLRYTHGAAVQWVTGGNTATDPGQHPAGVSMMKGDGFRLNTNNPREYTRKIV